MNGVICRCHSCVLVLFWFCLRSSCGFSVWRLGLGYGCNTYENAFVAGYDEILFYEYPSNYELLHFTLSFYNEFDPIKYLR